MRDSIPCLKSFTVSDFRSLQSGCRTCAKKQRLLERRRAEYASQIKICILKASKEQLERIKQRLDTKQVIIYLDNPSYPKRNIL